MERILLINGISPYLYFLVLCLLPEDIKHKTYTVYPVVFLVQLLITVILAIICKDKARLSKITMINKLIQIPYYIVFFVISVGAVIFGLSLMGIGLILIPVFIIIDLGVFLSTMIPEEICTIKLRSAGHIPTSKFILYFIGNAFYVIDVVLSVMIYREYSKRGKQS